MVYQSSVYQNACKSMRKYIRLIKDFVLQFFIKSRGEYNELLILVCGNQFFLLLFFAEIFVFFMEKFFDWAVKVTYPSMFPIF